MSHSGNAKQHLSLDCPGRRVDCAGRPALRGRAREREFGYKLVVKLSWGEFPKVIESSICTTRAETVAAKKPQITRGILPRGSFIAAAR